MTASGLSLLSRRLRGQRSRLLALGMVAALATGCSGIASPSNNQNDSFSGTVTPETGSSAAVITHTFSVNKTGEMSARITSISPNNASLIGLALGQLINGGCSVFTLNNLTGLNRDVFITSIQKGSYCIQVFNGGGVAAAQSYQLTVNHP